MSHHEFDPNCPDCRPAIIDARTGKPMPDDDPKMKKVLSLWEALPRASQEAFHRVTVKNSRDPNDLRIMKAFADQISQVFQE